MLARSFGGWVVGAGLLGIVAVLIMAHLMKIWERDPTRGTTTDVAMLLMFCVGALLVVGPLPVAIVVGGGVAVLLQYKPELHGFVRRLGDDDLKAIMQFVLITCIVLPVLPDHNYGPAPLDVFNPRETWLMVVLIVGISLGGYIVYKFFGRDAGILLGGLLGGAISSTATTVSYARRAHGNPMSLRTSAIVIMIASTVVYVRVLIEVAVVAQRFLLVVAPPVIVLMILTLLPALAVWVGVRRSSAPMPKQENPTQLRSALVFGLMYALVLFVLAAADAYQEQYQQYIGRYIGIEGLYVAAGISGLTDMDAITLATARMSLKDPTIAAEGWRMIVVGALANLFFKAGIAGFLGGWRLLARVALLFSVPLIGGALLLAFWPAGF
jgi:uncharacterized membrane protein (DUF4010 family)